MSMYDLVFAYGCIALVAGALWYWTTTPSGKEWIKKL